jgi:uncharacterized flavoprotein (TIGR03862 family)
MKGLGIESYIGSSGRVFPIEMKAAPLLRAWLKRLLEQGISFHYRHQVTNLQSTQLTVLDLKQNETHTEAFDAVILACGAVSWSQLGSDGAWQSWLQAEHIEPFQASNAGVEYPWSQFMHAVFGQPLKRVEAWVGTAERSIGDIVISHYGLESGLIYKQGRALRAMLKAKKAMTLYLDLMPELSVEQLAHKLQPSKKQSQSNVWRKAGLDSAKAALVRELVPKALWSQPEVLAKQIKALCIPLTGFRPIEEAISCAGGVKREVLSAQLQLKQQSCLFCAGEMLDWDAPTGGYLLTACFATGRAAGEGVHTYLQSN